MADDQNNLGQNNSTKTKEVYRDPVGNLDMVQPSTTGESLSNNPFLRGPATNVANPNENSTASEQYAYSGTEPISPTAPQPTSGDVTARIESIKAFLGSQMTTPAKGLNDLFSIPPSSVSSENQTSPLKASPYSPKTHLGLVQQRLQKKAA